MYGENGSATYGRNGVSERKNTSEIVHIRSSPYVITVGGGVRGGQRGGWSEMEWAVGRMGKMRVWHMCVNKHCACEHSPWAP